MFGVSSLELLLIFIIGLLILGPERLPRVAAQIGRWVAKARRTANQLRYQLEREVALDELYKSQKKQPPKRPAAPASPPDAAGPADAAPESESSTAPKAGDDAAATTPPAASADDAAATTLPAASAQEASVPPPATAPPAPVSRPVGSSEHGAAAEQLETTTADAEVEERR